MKIKAMMSIGVTMIGAWVFALGLRAIDLSQDCRLLFASFLQELCKLQELLVDIFLCDRTFIDDRLLWPQTCFFIVRWMTCMTWMSFEVLVMRGTWRQLQLKQFKGLLSLAATDFALTVALTAKTFSREKIVEREGIRSKKEIP